MSQPRSSIEMSIYGLTYRLTMSNPKIYTSNVLAISIFMSFFFQKNSLSLEFFSLCKKKKSPLLLLLNKCKTSYFIGYRCLNLRLPTSETMSREIFGYSRSKSQCFQVQLVTCCDLLVFHLIYVRCILQIPLK